MTDLHDGQPINRCSGCNAWRRDCQPLWASERKCCPDCSHTPVYPRNLSPQQLEPHFSKHMEAMTAERLDGKFEIAEQLAWRDQRTEFLWKLLDDIDTLGDQHKPRRTPYFHAVNTAANLRHQVLVSLDGHSLQPASVKPPGELRAALDRLEDCVSTAHDQMGTDFPGCALDIAAIQTLRALIDSATAKPPPHNDLSQEVTHALNDLASAIGSSPLVDYATADAALTRLHVLTDELHSTIAFLRKRAE